MMVATLRMTRIVRLTELEEVCENIGGIGKPSHTACCQRRTNMTRVKLARKHTESIQDYSLQQDDHRRFYQVRLIISPDVFGVLGGGWIRMSLGDKIWEMRCLLL
jgi:hypothetical protein